MSAIVNPGSSGGGGGGSMNILEDGATVVAAATALNFVEPGLTLVTDAGGGQANVAMASYLPYVGRTGAISAKLSTDDDGTFFGSAATGKALFLGSNSVDAATPEIAIQHMLFVDQESLAIGHPVLGGFFPFTVSADIGAGESSTCGLVTVGGDAGAGPFFFGVGGQGSIGAFTTSSEFQACLQIGGVAVDADNALTFGFMPVVIELHVDGTPGSGYAPGQLVFILTGRDGESHNTMWMRHNGRIGIGEDLGSPDARVQIQNVRTPDTVGLSVQGNILADDQTANLQNWEGRIYGEADLGAGPGFNQVGDTQIQMIDSSVFPSSGFVWLFQADNSLGTDLLVEFTANNTGTNVLTLAAPLTFAVQFVGMYITTILSSVDKQGIFIAPSINDPGGGGVAAPVAGMILFDTNINKHVGYDGTTWNAMY